MSDLIVLSPAFASAAMARFYPVNFPQNFCVTGSTGIRPTLIYPLLIGYSVSGEGVNADRTLFDGLFTTYLVIAIVVTVIVFGAVAIAVVLRRRKGPEPAGPEPVAGNLPVEIAFATLFTLIIAFVMVRTFSTGEKVDAHPAADQKVEVTAFQWGWRFTYPDAGFAVEGDSIDNPELVVPADRQVGFTLNSKDVIHSFWIPAERFKRDAIPGRTNRFNLVFNSPERTFGQCAEYCGLDHSTMGFDVTVLEPAEFDRWLEQHRDAASAGEPR